jgi:selenocysteine lyase/cysteine desulfurase
VWTIWNDAADEARRSFASFVGVDAGSVAVGHSTSGFVGLVAASLPAGAEVVIPDCEFTALLFPFLVQTARGVTVRAVPLEALADAVGPQTAAVAWSAVQSGDGRIADTDAVLEAAGRVGALTVLDATQATGWLPVPYDRVDAVVCSAYKWLCCPRGTAFMVSSRRVLDGCLPHAASWFAAEDVHGGYYGMPLRLAHDARRLDASPGWFAWMGAVTSLEVLAGIGIPAIHDHDVGLADGLRATLGVEPSGSAIVSVVGDGLEPALAERGVRVATRAGGCRMAFHVYNDEDDVEVAAAALQAAGRPLVVT